MLESFISYTKRLINKAESNEFNQIIVQEIRENVRLILEQKDVKDKKPMGFNQAVGIEVHADGYNLED